MPRNARLKILSLLLLLSIPVALEIEAQKVLRGKASYYSDRLHGNLMSNGQRYHRDSLTCAHRKFPFGTKIRVKNVSNGKEVIVTVTDRGPYSKRYILDLSRAAASQLGILRAGFCQCEITPLDENLPPSLFPLENEAEELPRLNLTPDSTATYPNPAWQRDTITNSRATVLPPPKTTLPTSLHPFSSHQSLHLPQPILTSPPTRQVHPFNTSILQDQHVIIINRVVSDGKIHLFFALQALFS